MFTRIIENINSIVKVISSGSMPELIDIKKLLNLQTEKILHGVKMEIKEVVTEMQAMATQLDKVQTEVQDHTAAMQDSMATLEASLRDALAKANTEAPLELLDAMAAVKQRIQKLDDLNVDKVLPVEPAPVEALVVEPVAEVDVAPEVPVETAPVEVVAEEPAVEVPVVDLTKTEEAPTV